MNEHSERRRLIIVSNRLPFTASQENGELVFKESSGGVATGLRTYLNSFQSVRGDIPEYIWVGWPGNSLEGHHKDQLKSRALADFHSYPVFLSEQDMELFYHGFCNKTIWPLFHYFPTYTLFKEEHWQHYKHVNKVFCDTILEIANEGDVIWIHDYHLMLLPALLRARQKKTPIGFFLHIPFPSYEVFRLLPGTWRREILEGLLGSDLIGFHTYGYMQYFLQCVLRILGHENNLGQMSLPNCIVKADAFPMGIDFKKFHSAMDSSQVQKEKETLKKSLTEVRTVLSVDRLDYTKGILNRLQGFELLLEQNPQFHEKVVLLMIVVPSRIGVDQYEQMKKQIEELVGKINGRFGGISWTPVIYQYKNLSFEPLAALYGACDVALVTPLRDGMNLVAKEYIASRTDKSGVLVLSEMAGASKELAEAIVINPNHIQDIAQGLKEALEMPLDEQQRRNQIMQNRLQRYDVARWANDFIDRLLAMKQVNQRFDARVLPDSAKQRLLEHYQRAGRRLIFLDYDGTLVPFKPHPHLAKPGKEILTLLQSLSSSPKNSVVLISGRDKFTLQKWFGKLPLQLVAEHGTWIKEKHEDWKMLKQLASEWKQSIIPILELYADRLPGAFVEEKEYSVVWHYRAAHPEQGQLLARELTDHLVTFTANIDVQVLQGNKVIEIRNAGVNKGIAGQHLISQERFDFVLAIGDDWTDEDLFIILPDPAYTIRVGITNSHARFNLRDSGEVIALLKLMTMMDPPDTHRIEPEAAATAAAGQSSFGDALTGRR